jgi:uncharacterized membrane protein HdeD (DUF308 family)
VSVPDIGAVRPERYWVVPIARALVAAVIAIIITFSANHSAVLGYILFGAFTVVTGVVIAILAFRIQPAGTERTFFFAQSIVSIVLGIVSLLTSTLDVAFLLFLVGAWAIIAGVLELYCGVRARRTLAQSRDWRFVGGVTVLFAIAAFLIPANYRDDFTGPDGVARSITASTILVGALGVYTAIVCVYLVIGGLSLKWASQRSIDTAPQGGN